MNSTITFSLAVACLITYFNYASAFTLRENSSLKNHDNRKLFRLWSNDMFFTTLPTTNPSEAPGDIFNRSFISTYGKPKLILLIKVFFQRLQPDEFIEPISPPIESETPSSFQSISPTSEKTTHPPSLLKSNEVMSFFPSLPMDDPDESIPPIIKNETPSSFPSIFSSETPTLKLNDALSELPTIPLEGLDESISPTIKSESSSSFPSIFASIGIPTNIPSFLQSNDVSLLPSIHANEFDQSIQPTIESEILSYSPTIILSIEKLTNISNPLKLNETSVTSSFPSVLVSNGSSTYVPSINIPLETNETENQLILPPLNEISNNIDTEKNNRNNPENKNLVIAGIVAAMGAVLFAMFAVMARRQRQSA